MSVATQQVIEFDGPRVRYFRNCNPASYCALQGDRVTYFAPHVPQGFVSDDITPSVIFRYAEKQPHLDGEIDIERVEKIRAGWIAEGGAQ
jgi:hypothetical protein